jgi:hypothetical protein
MSREESPSRVQNRITQLEPAGGNISGTGLPCRPRIFRADFDPCQKVDRTTVIDDLSSRAFSLQQH